MLMQLQMTILVVDAISKASSTLINPIALRKAKIAYNFGLSECNRVKHQLPVNVDATSKVISILIQHQILRLMLIQPQMVN